MAVDSLARMMAVKALAEGGGGQVGPPGKPGKDGKDGKDGVDGKDGINGKDGVGIKDVEINPKGSTEEGMLYDMEIVLEDGNIIQAGDFIAPTGPKGDQGEPGERGEEGAPGPKGEDGTNGIDGVSVESFADAGTSEDGDYTTTTVEATLSNGTKSIFNVLAKNGKDGIGQIKTRNYTLPLLSSSGAICEFNADNVDTTDGLYCELKIVGSDNSDGITTMCAIPTFDAVSSFTFDQSLATCAGVTIDSDWGWWGSVIDYNNGEHKVIRMRSFKGHSKTIGNSDIEFRDYNLSNPQCTLIVYYRAQGDSTPQPTTPSSVKTRTYELPDFNGQKGIFGLKDINWNNAFLVGFKFSFSQNTGANFVSNYIYADANYISNIGASNSAYFLGVFDLANANEQPPELVKAYASIGKDSEYGNVILLSKIDYVDSTAGDININVDTMKITATVYYTEGELVPGTVSQDDFNALKAQVESFISGEGNFYKTATSTTNN